MLIKKIVDFFKSLKLTVTLLAFSVVLVFIGTLAQADEGALWQRNRITSSNGW